MIKPKCLGNQADQDRGPCILSNQLEIS